MKKKACYFISLCVLTISICSNTPVYARGARNILNQSAQAWITGNARFAETEAADTPLHNPAGTAMMEDGTHLHLSAFYMEDETVLKNTSTGQKYSFESIATIPYFAVTHKQDDWAGFFTLSYPGGQGGGTADRFPLFDYLAAQYSALYSMPISAENQKAILGGGAYAYTLGGAYRLNETMSLGYGLRQITFMGLVKAEADFVITGTDTTIGSIKFDSTAEGTGIGHTLSFDIKTSKEMLIGLRYDTEVPIETTVSVGSEDNSGAVDGSKKNQDLPAVLMVGMAYRMSEEMKLDAVFGYYFQKGVDMAGGTDETDKWENAYELGASLSYKSSPKLTITGGLNYSYVGIPEDVYTAENALAAADVLTIGGWLDYFATPDMKVSGGLGTYFYPRNERTPSDPMGDHERSNAKAIALGIGIEYKI